MESSPDCIQILDLETKVLSINERGAMLLEIEDTGAYLQRSWLEFWKGNEREQAEKAVAEARAGRVGRFQATSPTRKGASRWWDVSVSPVLAEDGRATGLVAVLRDVSEQKSAEYALRERERRFRAVFNQRFQFMAVLSADGKVLEVNDLALRAAGVSSNEVVGRLFWECPWWRDLPEMKAAWPARLAEAAKGEGPVLSEDLYQAMDGSVRIAAASITPVKGAKGAVDLFIVEASDITERRGAERQIQTTLQHLQLIADAAENLLKTENPLELLETIYEKLSAMFGVDFYFHFALGLPSEPATLRAWRGIAEEAATRIENEFGEAICGAAANDLRPVVIADVQGAREHNTDFMRAEGVTAYACFPLAPAGRLTGTVSFGTHQGKGFSPELVETLRAVTDLIAAAMARKESEEALRRSEALKTGMLNSGLDAIITIDHESRIIEWNAAAERTFGYPREQVVGKSMTELIVPPALRQAHARGMARYMATGQTHILGRRIEIAGMRQDGSEFPCELTVVRVPLEGAPRFTAFVRDITEQKEIEHSLARAREQLEEHARTLETAVAERTRELKETIGELETFSYSMSHDLRAPLRAIVSFAELLGEETGKKLGPPATDYALKITRAAERMDRLIQDVLTYSRVVRQDIRMESIDLEALLTQIIAEHPAFQPPAAYIEIKAPLLRVLGHEASLTQCIYNLIGNSLKFVAPGVTPRVTIWTDAVSGGVRLWFQDNGIGIPKEAQQTIFGMFQRLHRQDQYPGTGIGLAIVRKAVERMGGRVGVESAGGPGSRFWIELRRGER